jgi:hypothetical protein
VKKELLEQMPEVALKNQAPSTGQQVLLEIDGVFSLHAHADNYERAEYLDARLRAEIDWIEKFTSHGPSVGTHYEKVLSDLASEYLPGGLSVGTGFIYDSFREVTTPQIDLICYSDRLVSPIHRRGDFVIVQPEAVKAVCEVKKTLKCADLKSWVKKTMGCNMGNGASKPRGVQEMSVFAYNCPIKTKTVAQALAEATKEFLGGFVRKTRDGSLAVLGVQQLCLPSIYMHDREDFISVSIERSHRNSLDGRIIISVLRSGGPNGVTPFLGSLSAIVDTGVEKARDARDHCSSFLQEIVDETTLDIPVVLSSYMGSFELIRRFPEAKIILQKNRAHGVRFSSFEDPGKHRGLASFASAVGFSWCIDEPIMH